MVFYCCVWLLSVVLLVAELVKSYRLGLSLRHQDRQFKSMTLKAVFLGR